MEGKFVKYFRSVVPVGRLYYAEVIRKFVADEGSKQIIDIYTLRLMFPKNIVKVKDFIQPISEEIGAGGKGYILIRLKSIGS